MLSIAKADLAHFDALFAQSADPWGTRTNSFERHKRNCLAACLGSVRIARLLELGCGNGSNTRLFAKQALCVHACDGAPSAVERTRVAVGGLHNVQTFHLPLPDSFPADRYDAIVIAELLYYLDDRAFDHVAKEIDRTLRPGGRLLLCHHHKQFHDAAQRQAGLHRRALSRTRSRWTLHRYVRTGRWEAHLLGRTRT